MSSSRGPATISARRSPTCRRCSRRSRTASSSPRRPFPCSASRSASSRRSSTISSSWHASTRARSRSSCARHRSSRWSSPACAASRRMRDATRDRPRRERAGRRHRALRAGEGRAGAVQPPHERPAPHAVGRLGRRSRRAGRPGGAGQRRGHGRGSRSRGALADVRPLLARRSGPLALAARGSDSRSPAASSRPTAVASGPRIAPAAAPACRSRSRPGPESPVHRGSARSRFATVRRRARSTPRRTRMRS